MEGPVARVDISNQTSNHVRAGFDHPPRLAKTAKTEEEAFAHYGRVRDEIQAFVETLPYELEE